MKFLLSKVAVFLLAVLALSLSATAQSLSFKGFDAIGWEGTAFSRAVTLFSQFSGTAESRALPVIAVVLQSSKSESSTRSTSEANSSAPANESKEASEDETEQFKHSASIRLLSKITGLSIDHAYWLAVVLNFAIVAGVIAWFSKKNLPEIFRNRTASIQKSLEEARKASEDANRRLSDIESRLARLGDEINQMRASSEKEAAAEEERIKAAAADDGRRIVESAQQEIDRAAKSARRELTAYAADLAVSLAAKQIRVDVPTDQALVRRFAQQLTSDGSKGNN